MTAEGALSSVVDVSCEHRHKKSLFKSKDVRKKLKSCKRLCEECERNTKNGMTHGSPNDGLFICVSCGYLTCLTHAKKHWEAVRTGDKHPLLLNLDSCEMRCQACDVVLTPLDDPQDLIKSFCNEYRCFIKTRPEPKPVRNGVAKQLSSCEMTSQGDVKVTSTQLVRDSADEELLSRESFNLRRKRWYEYDEPECMIPAKGLVNLGNTCFFNSVMQCMMHTHHLTYYFQRFGKVKCLNFRGTQTVVVNEEKIELEPATINIPTEGTPLNSVLRGFIAEFYCGATPSPGPVFSQISCKTPRFKGYQQQDAHELLRYLLDGLRSEELETYKSGISSHFGVPTKTNKKNIDKETVNLAKGYLQAAGRPLLDMVFGGTLLQTILCSECGHVSERHEQFLDLSIPVTMTGSGRFRAGRSANSVTSKRQQQGKKIRRKGSRRVTSQNGDVNEDEMVVSPEDHSCYEENGQYSGDEMERLAAGINRLDFTKVLVCPPEEYTDGVCSIGSCMLEFTAAEKLEDANAYECEKCCVPRNKKMKGVANQKKRVCAFKRYLVYEPPAVLTLHLKRFQQLEGMCGRTSTRKISGHVSFPVMFDMAPFCCKNVERISPGEKRLLYSLYGVVVHSGSLSGGHYVAYVKSRPRLKQAHSFLESARTTCADSLSCHSESSINYLHGEPELPSDGQWYYCSDSQVLPVTESRVLSAEAYILFYERAAEKIGIVEETKLEPTFEDGIKKVESYRLALDAVLDGLELMMQPNRLVLETGAINSPPKQNPYELAASGLTKLKQFMNNKLESRLDIVINAMNKMASTERAAQTKGRAVIRRIRRFVTVDNEEMKTDMEKMYAGLEQMDVARHEVKNSKTKEELEEKGIFYQKSVKSFNDQASKIQLVIDELPSTAFTNQREVVKFFAHREKFHASAVEILKEAVENLNKK